MKVILSLVALGVGAFGADSEFHLWKAAELSKIEKGLPAKMDAQKIGSEGLAKTSTAHFQLSHREGPGIGELHVKTADIFFVESGEATLVVGGTLAAEKTTAPNEKRGSGVQGGTKHKLAAGDVVTIPPGMPHQLILDAGKQFTYFVVKVEAK